MSKIIFSNYDSIKNPYYGGGGAISIHKIAVALAKSNNSVTIIAGAYPGSKNEIIYEVKYQYIGIPYLKKLNQLLYLLILPYYIINSIFDLWVESFIPPFSTTFVPFWTKRTVVGFAQLLNSKEFSKKYFGIPFYLIEEIALKKYRHIMALTDTVKSRVNKINPGCDVVVFGLGFDKPLNIQHKSKMDPYYLYFGRIDIFQKGIDLLLSAYSNASSAIPKLLLAGSGSTTDLSNLKKIIHSYNLENRVKLIGKISGEVKSRILSNAIATIVPSRYETFCLSALESIAHGTKVVVSDIKELSWIPDIAKHQFRLSDTSTLTNLLNILYKEPVRDISTRNQLYSSISKYEWPKVTKRYITYLNRMAKL